MMQFGYYICVLDCLSCSHAGLLAASEFGFYWIYSYFQHRGASGSVSRASLCLQVHDKHPDTVSLHMLFDHSSLNNHSERETDCCSAQWRVDAQRHALMDDWFISQQQWGAERLESVFIRLHIWLTENGFNSADAAMLQNVLTKKKKNKRHKSRGGAITR